jgi:hypothetical protein
MNNKKPSITLIALGALILLASLFADVTGIGDDPGFGNQQIAGSILGVIILLVGAYFYRQSGESASDDQD